MNITFYGHACYGILANGQHIVVDPFITPNNAASHIKLAEVKADYILVTHGHEDHVADLIELATITGAKVVAAYEICTWLNEKGITNTLPMNIGGKKVLDFGWVKMVHAAHSSVLPDGTYGGNPAGYLLNDKNKTVYIAGDTALHMDMQLIPLWSTLSLAILPIGDTFTMGVVDAMLACDLIKCNTVMGVHYNTFPPIAIEPGAAQRAFTAGGKTLLLPEIGESIVV